MDEGVIKTKKIENINKTPLPLRERQAFQCFLLQSMLNNRSKYKNDEEWNNEGMKWVEEYGKIVSDIIDNIKNKEIRNLIMEEKYKEASIIVSKILFKKK